MGCIEFGSGFLESESTYEPHALTGRKDARGYCIAKSLVIAGFGRSFGSLKSRIQVIVICRC